MTTQNWYAAKAGNDSQGLIIEEGTGRNVAVAYDVKDAPLLAAARDMLEALRDAVQCNPYSVGHSKEPRWLEGANAAIAKAEGR